MIEAEHGEQFPPPVVRCETVTPDQYKEREELARLKERSRSIYWWTCLFGHRWSLWEHFGHTGSPLVQRRRCRRCQKWQGQELP